MNPVGCTAPSLASRVHRKFRTHPLSAVAAAVTMAWGLPASAEIVEWTGNAPVYLVQWDEHDGVGLRSVEFKFFDQWHDFCLDRQTNNGTWGASCLQFNFWDSKANWVRPDPAGSAIGIPGLPTANDTARIPEGAYVWISPYMSDFQGSIGNVGVAENISSKGTIYLGGTLNLESGGAVKSLLMSPGSTLRVKAGNLQVDAIALSFATLTGAGSTSAATFGLGVDATIDGGHTLGFGGYDALGNPIRYIGPFTLHIGDSSTFVVSAGGILDMSTGGAGFIDSQGSTTWPTAPHVWNLGEMWGPFTLTGARFDNDGYVRIEHGLFLTSGYGTHHGFFFGGADSTLSFESKVGLGHHFLPGSSVSSDGQVVFNGTGNLVEGSYWAADTVVGTTGAQLVFKGGSKTFGKLTVNPSSSVSFDQTSGVSFTDLVINGANAFAYLTTTTPSTVQRLTIAGGGVNTSNTLTVTDHFDWGSGDVVGPVTLNGTTALGAGTRKLYAGSTLRNAGTLSWNDGTFALWSGRVVNAAGALFDIRGDFAYGDGTGGSLDNAGTLRKSAGSGTTILPVAVNNTGTVNVTAGTLGLYGGGRHTGQFTAAPGARLVLGGDQVIAGAVGTSGRVDVVSAGAFSVLGSGSYTHAAGNTMSVAQLSVAAGGRFDNRGTFDIDWNHPAKVDNQGTLNNFGSFSALSLANGGAIVNAAGGTMTFGALGLAMATPNTGRIDNAGSFWAAGLDNRGAITNNGAMTLLDLTQRGTLDNRSALTLTGLVAAGGRIDNRGKITADGNLTIAAGGQIRGAGSFVGNGTTFVDGVLEATGGIDIEGVLKGNGTVIGPVVIGPNGQWLPGASPGAMTVQGNVDVQGSIVWPGLPPGGPPLPCIPLCPPTNPTGNPSIVIEIASPTVYDRLTVTGTATVNGVVDFAFLSGYTPSDGDSFKWLSAGGIAGIALPTVSGLPAGWSGELVPDSSALRLVLTNEPTADFTTQIDASGAVTVAPAQVASNWNSGFQAPNLVRLDNAGWFINKPAASMSVSDVGNAAGATFANHGSMTVWGSLDNAGELRNRAGADLTVNGTLTNTGRLINGGTLNVGNSSFGGLVNEAGARIDNHGIINRDYFAQIVNRGTFSTDGTINNPAGWNPYQATILNDGGTFIVLPGGAVTGDGSYQQSYDGTTQVDGRLQAADIHLLGGWLTGSGTLAGPVRLGIPIVQPGHSPGTLTIDGNLGSQGASFDIELAGPGVFDVVHVTGSASFGGGLVHFVLLDGYQPHAGDSFAWLIVDRGASGLNLLHWELFDGTRVWSDAYPMPDLWVSFSGDRISFASPTPVPEPYEWVLWLAGLAAMGGFLGGRRGRETFGSAA